MTSSKAIWKLEFTKQAQKFFNKLDSPIKQRIKEYFDNNLLKQHNPRALGKQLSGSHHDKWSYRVGDYRILAQIKDREMIILAVDVGHRREVYKVIH
jgi:mRNA interferase RelE/StbE